MDVRTSSLSSTLLTGIDPSLLAWSAPSAIGLGGVGFGGQAGAEMTEFLIVLNSRSVSVRPQPYCALLTNLTSVARGLHRLL
jgi:lipid-binding SYLF domain-containing protein